MNKKEILIGKSGAKVFEYDNYIIKIDNDINRLKIETNALEKFSCKEIPKVLEFNINKDKAILKMSKIYGTMLCDGLYLSNLELLYNVLSKSFHFLWNYKNINNFKFYTIDDVIKNLQKEKENYPEIDKVLDETNFKSIEDLLKFLIENKPKEQLVLSHGDLCLPNIFGNNESFSGFVDCQKFAIRDIYYDIIDCTYSLYNNFYGIFNSGKYTGYDEDIFFERIGLKKNIDKFNYYKIAYLLY